MKHRTTRRRYALHAPHLVDLSRQVERLRDALTRQGGTILHIVHDHGTAPEDAHRAVVHYALPFERA